MSVTKAPRPCMRDCGRAAQRGKRKCGWCALSEKPIAEQLDAARWRRQQAERRPGYVFAARVKPDLWPPGYRWCSDCQMMIPLDQCRGSKCLAHSSSSAHES